MNLEHLKKQLEPFIRAIVRDELQRDKKNVMKNARDAIGLLQEFTGMFDKKNKKNKNAYDGEDLKI